MKSKKSFNAIVTEIKGEGSHMLNHNPEYAVVTAQGGLPQQQLIFRCEPSDAPQVGTYVQVTLEW